MRAAHRRRAEGHAEYVIILSLIMICALASFMAVADGIKEIYNTSQVCIDCPIAKTREELDAIRADLEAKENEGSISEEEREYLEDVERELKRRDDKEAIEAAGESPDAEANEATRSTTDSFLWAMADVFSWLGGGRFWWELFGLV